MNLNLANKEDRRVLADNCETEYECNRRINSYKEWDIYNGNIQPYVATRLKQFFGNVKDYPEVSCINVAKKITEASSKIYKKPPIREFSGITEDQEVVFEQIYKSVAANRVMKHSSRVFKYDQIAHIGLFVKDGEFELKYYRQHELVVLENEIEERREKIYILPHQMKEGYDQSFSSKKLKYTVWAPGFHFIMEGDGSLVEDFGNPLSSRGTTPFISISDIKNVGYWPEGKNQDAEFTIQLNQAFSEYNHVVRVQGIAYGLMILDSKQAAKIRKGQSSVRIGVNKVMILESKEGEKDPNFNFISPSPDLSGMKDFIEGLVNIYLTSKGLDSKGVVSLSGQTASFTSGFDRLLSQIQDFEESMDQIDIFKKAEYELFKKIVDWQVALSGTDSINPEYQMRGLDEQEASIMVTFAKPEIVKSESEIVEIVKAKEDAGYISRVQAIMKVFGYTREQAIEHLEQIQVDEREFPVATESTGLQETDPS